MPGIRNFGIISELGWDYDVKLFEDGLNPEDCNGQRHG